MVSGVFVLCCCVYACCLCVCVFVCFVRDLLCDVI